MSGRSVKELPCAVSEGEIGSPVGEFMTAKPELQEGRGLRSAYISSTREAGPHAHQVQDSVAVTAGVAPAPRRLHARVYADPEEAELGAAQGCACSPDQRYRGHHVHSGH